MRKSSFVHPAPRKNSFFPWDPTMEPPLIANPQMINSIRNIPRRIPVIVRNHMKTKEQLPNLNQSMKEMNLV